MPITIGVFVASLLIQNTTQDFEHARLRWKSLKWLTAADAGAGATSNVYYSEQGEKFGFLTKGQVLAVAQIDQPTWEHRHWGIFPFEIFPAQFNQSHWDVEAGADVVFKPLQAVKSQFLYAFNRRSDPAVFESEGRLQHQDHTFSAQGDFHSRESDYSIHGGIKAFRVGYESVYNHLSNTQFRIDLALRKPVYPESIVSFFADGINYRYDVTGTTVSSSNSRWVEGGIAFDGTIGRDATLKAQLKAQLALYDRSTPVIEPGIDVGITERIFGTSTITAGLLSAIENSSYSHFVRNTSLYFRSQHLFFDSWYWTGLGEFTLRHFSGGGDRTDHYLAFKSTIELPWRRILSFFAEGQLAFNFSDIYASSAQVAAGEERFASYDKIDVIFGIRSTY